MQKSLVIPNDLAACQSLLAELAQRLEEQAQRLAEVQRENAEQKLTISELLRRAFEKRSERYLENPDQLRLDFGDTAEAASAAFPGGRTRTSSTSTEASHLGHTSTKCVISTDTATLDSKKSPSSTAAGWFGTTTSDRG